MKVYNYENFLVVQWLHSKHLSLKLSHILFKLKLYNTKEIFLNNITIRNCLALSFKVVLRYFTSGEEKSMPFETRCGLCFILMLFLRSVFFSVLCYILVFKSFLIK